MEYPAAYSKSTTPSRSILHKYLGRMYNKTGTTYELEVKTDKPTVQGNQSSDFIDGHSPVSLTTLWHNNPCRYDL